jgi:hypothetical protein
MNNNYSSDILRGLLSGESDEVQLLWIKYLAIANETEHRNGRLEYSKGKPYPIEFIASMCRKSISDIKRIEGMLVSGDKPRLFIEPDGTRVIIEWGKYIKGIR